MSPPKGNEWVIRYARSHQHPVNRACHTIGIPMIMLSIALAPVAIAVGGIWWLALALFVGGWVLQIIGHAFEGKPPEFFSDWRFLFVGVKWWFEKLRGRA